MLLNFTKMHGLGNDFIIVNLFTEISMNFQGVAKRLCDRRFGIGADGVILITRPASKENQLKMVIYNSDGSEADMCGNGMRCFARYAFDKGLVNSPEFKVETKAGIIIPRVQLANDKFTGVRVNMGKPRFKPEEVPIKLEGLEVINQEARINNTVYRINAISMGNPHCVIFCEDVNNIPLEVIGSAMETDPIFPAKANIEFAQVLNTREVRMRVWERGAGITQACGTGACATAIAAAKNGLTDREVTVHLPGGDLFIEWAEDGVVYMTGPAVYVYTGVIEL